LSGWSVDNPASRAYNNNNCNEVKSELTIPSEKI
jgi:hypothetical protein